ncbi:hypothetical protein EI555_015862 [Monodon monoceros]|uniref:Ferritin light chain n=1 Tax=Monodon monoceros TaxID=40151 RepID=A0A4U1FFS6_MONMO|nr:hypothetical protein EI555_015862 [Monodon monoceros]
MQTQCGGRPLFQEEQKPPQYEWGKTQDAVGVAVLAEKNLNQTLEDPPALGCAPADPRLCDFRESHFREKQVAQGNKCRLSSNLAGHRENANAKALTQQLLECDSESFRAPLKLKTSEGLQRGKQMQLVS